MSIIKRGGFVLACAFLLVLPFAFALDFLGFYSDFYGWLDFFIFFLTLSFLFEIALSTMFEGAEGKHHKFALALGGLCSFALVTWEVRSGFSLGDFAPFVLLFLLLFFVALLYNFVKHKTKGAGLYLVLGLLLFFLIGYLWYPKLFSWLPYSDELILFSLILLALLLIFYVLQGAGGKISQTLSRTPKEKGERAEAAEGLRQTKQQIVATKAREKSEKKTRTTLKKRFAVALHGNPSDVTLRSNQRLRLIAHVSGVPRDAHLFYVWSIPGYPEQFRGEDVTSVDLDLSLFGFSRSWFGGRSSSRKVSARVEVILQPDGWQARSSSYTFLILPPGVTPTPSRTAAARGGTPASGEEGAPEFVIVRSLPAFHTEQQRKYLTVAPRTRVEFFAAAHGAGDVFWRRVDGGATRPDQFRLTSRLGRERGLRVRFLFRDAGLFTVGAGLVQDGAVVGFDSVIVSVEAGAAPSASAAVALDQDDTRPQLSAPVASDDVALVAPVRGRRGRFTVASPVTPVDVRVQYTRHNGDVTQIVLQLEDPEGNFTSLATFTPQSRDETFTQIISTFPAGLGQYRLTLQVQRAGVLTFVDSLRLVVRSDLLVTLLLDRVDAPAHLSERGVWQWRRAVIVAPHNHSFTCHFSVTGPDASRVSYRLDYALQLSGRRPRAEDYETSPEAASPSLQFSLGPVGAAGEYPLFVRLHELATGRVLTEVRFLVQILAAGEGAPRGARLDFPVRALPGETYAGRVHVPLDDVGRVRRIVWELVPHARTPAAGGLRAKLHQAFAAFRKPRAAPVQRKAKKASTTKRRKR